MDAVIDSENKCGCVHHDCPAVRAVGRGVCNHCAKLRCSRSIKRKAELWAGIPRELRQRLDHHAREIEYLKHQLHTAQLSRQNAMDARRQMLHHLLSALCAIMCVSTKAELHHALQGLMLLNMADPCACDTCGILLAVVGWTKTSPVTGVCLYCASRIEDIELAYQKKRMVTLEWINPVLNALHSMHEQQLLGLAIGVLDIPQKVSFEEYLPEYQGRAEIVDLAELLLGKDCWLGPLDELDTVATKSQLKNIKRCQYVPREKPSPGSMWAALTNRHEHEHEGLWPRTRATEPFRSLITLIINGTSPSWSDRHIDHAGGYNIALGVNVPGEWESNTTEPLALWVVAHPNKAADMMEWWASRPKGRKGEAVLRTFKGIQEDVRSTRFPKDVQVFLQSHGEVVTEVLMSGSARACVEAYRVFSLYPEVDQPMPDDVRVAMVVVDTMPEVLSEICQ